MVNVARFRGDIMVKNRLVGSLFVPGLGLALILLYLVSQGNYLLFHVLVELASIAVAWGVFMLAWNSRQFLDNQYILFLGLALPFIGVIDLLHTLAYKGMGIFPGYDANLPTQLWIAARYLHSLSLLVAPLVLGRRLNIRKVLLGYAAITVLLVALVFSRSFPAAYVEGAGLTPFKIVSEYVICLVLLGAMGLLLRRRHHFDPAVFRWLTWSIALTIGSELSFTLYTDVYGFSNMIGHLFKVAAVYLIYKAVIETGLSRPYQLLFRNLKNREETLAEVQSRLQAILNNTQQAFMLLDRQGRVQAYNLTAEREARAIVGRSIRPGELAAHFLGNSEIFITSFNRALTGETVTYEREVEIGKQRRWFILTHNPVLSETGQVVGVCYNALDITPRRQVEAERERLITELQAALGQVKTLSGLLPICSSCKMIRDDQGYWHQVEAYIGAHTGVDFSHSICPDCRVKLYPKEQYPFLYENK